MQTTPTSTIAESSASAPAQSPVKASNTSVAGGSHSLPNGEIAGVVIGAIIGALAVLGIILYLFRIRRRVRDTERQLAALREDTGRMEVGTRKPELDTQMAMKRGLIGAAVELPTESANRSLGLVDSDVLHGSDG